MVVSAANMRLKLAQEHGGELPTALAMYQKVRKGPGLKLILTLTRTPTLTPTQPQPQP